MTSIRSILAASTLLALAGLGNAAAAEAGSLVMKPNSGVSFDVGPERAVSYFLSENGICKLVLTLAEGDDKETFKANRFEADIAAEATTRFHSTYGKALEFTCAAGARALSVKPVAEIAGEAR